MPDIVARTLSGDESSGFKFPPLPGVKKKIFDSPPLESPLKGLSSVMMDGSSNRGKIYCEQPQTVSSNVAPIPCDDSQGGSASAGEKGYITVDGSANDGGQEVNGELIQVDGDPPYATQNEISLDAEQGAVKEAHENEAESADKVGEIALEQGELVEGEGVEGAGNEGEEESQGDAFFTPEGRRYVGPMLMYKDELGEALEQTVLIEQNHYSLQNLEYAKKKGYTPPRPKPSIPPPPHHAMNTGDGSDAQRVELTSEVKLPRRYCTIS